jgi:hypothetical protein
MLIHRWLLVIATQTSLVVKMSGSMWAFVPEQRDASFVGEINVPSTPSTVAITIVGPSKTTKWNDQRVLNFSFPNLEDGVAQEAKSKRTNNSIIPPDANWPKLDGTIGPVLHAGNDTIGRPADRNPWTVRTINGTHSEAFVVKCGGVIIGGAGGDVALLNGSIVREGDLISGFAVGVVTLIGVVLKRNGSSFVVPLGRNVTIRTVSS